MAWADGTVCAVSRNDELERYRAALRRQLNTSSSSDGEHASEGHVLTDLNRDRQGRCWCCTRAHERAFESPESRGVGSKPGSSQPYALSPPRPRMRAREVRRTMSRGGEPNPDWWLVDACLSVRPGIPARRRTPWRRASARTSPKHPRRGHASRRRRWRLGARHPVEAHVRLARQRELVRFGLDDRLAQLLREAEAHRLPVGEKAT